MTVRTKLNTSSVLFDQLPQSLAVFLPSLLSAFAILIIGWYFARFTGSFAQQFFIKNKVTKADLLSKSIRVIIFYFCIIFALIQVGLKKGVAESIILFSLLGLVFYVILSLFKK